MILLHGYIAPSVIDATHHNRSNGVVGIKVIFTATLPLQFKKDVFLSNQQNKHNFMNWLSMKLQDNAIKTLNADDDADLLIAKTAVDYSMTGVVHVLSEDNDLLVLHALTRNQDHLDFTSGQKKITANYPVWNILLSKKNLGEETCHVLLFIHATFGCDTTSRFFGIGKSSVIKKATNDKSFLNHAQTFCSIQNTATFQTARENALVCLYGGRHCDSLNSLWITKFNEKVAKNITCVDVQILPPTVDAAK